jgi:hypothetical protein
LIPFPPGASPVVALRMTTPGVMVSTSANRSSAGLSVMVRIMTGYQNLDALRPGIGVEVLQESGAKRLLEAREDTVFLSSRAVGRISLSHGITGAIPLDVQISVLLSGHTSRERGPTGPDQTSHVEIGYRIWGERGNRE